jgi:hypothetical protein
MAQLIRKCTNCGTIDERMTWKSTEDAARQGAFTEPWTCGSCAWSEFDLVDADEAGREQEPAATPAR